MVRTMTMLAVVAAALIAPAAVCADGTAPLRLRNGAGTAIYVCVDDGGRGAKATKTMQDGRPGTLLTPGATIRIPGTNLFDRPSIRIYNADGVEIYSKTILLLPAGGERWEQEWTGAQVVANNR